MSAQMELALDARDEALTAINERADETDAAVIDRVILWLAECRAVFSANDARDLLPTLASPHLLSARLASFRMRGLIEVVDPVGAVSSLVGTHSKRLATYRKGGARV